MKNKRDSLFKEHTSVKIDQNTLSYWQTTAASVTFSPHLPFTIDVAVVGGGITGVACCYWLAKAGHTVALLEGETLAYGATGRNGRIVSIVLAESYPGPLA